MSHDQLRALTKCATPETDESLAVEAQRMSAAQTYRMASRQRPVTTDEGREAHRTRSLKLWWDDTLMHLSGRLPKAEGAVVAKALERIAMQAAPNPETDVQAPYEQRCADALVELASARIADDSDIDRATVAVHIDAAVAAGLDGVAELEEGDAIAAETRRLLCDARWYPVLDRDDGAAIGVGRVTRQVPPWLLRELKRRDLGCVFPGCGRRRWVAAHHIVHWTQGGPTDLDNLVLLCGTHHRLVHEGGARVRLDGRHRAIFVLRTGRIISTSGPPRLREQLRRRLTGEEPERAPALLDTG